MNPIKVPLSSTTGAPGKEDVVSSMVMATHFVGDENVNHVGRGFGQWFEDQQWQYCEGSWECSVRGWYESHIFYFHHGDRRFQSLESFHHPA